MCCYDKRLSPVQQNLALTAIVMIGEDHQLIRLSFLIDSLLYIILSQSTYKHYLQHLPPAPHAHTDETQQRMCIMDIFRVTGEF